jgi:hypothetical protein
MTEASGIVLNGFAIRTDCPDEPNKYPHVIRYPHRFMDERGAEMWTRVVSLISRRLGKEAVA